MSSSGVEIVTWNHTPGELSPGKRLLQLEPLRGLAAINVFVGHFFLGFTPHAHGLLFPEELGGFIRSPLFAVMNGGSAVMFFFILSGFVLTAKAFEERDARPLGVSALRRWPRLALPTCLVSIAAAVLAILALYANGGVASLTGSEWLGAWRFSFSGRPPSVLGLGSRRLASSSRPPTCRMRTGSRLGSWRWWPTKSAA